MWMFMAPSLRIRFPEIVFRASKDGYNLLSLYASVKEFVDTYHYCILILLTAEDEKLGVFLDVIPDQGKNDRYIGACDTFIF